MKLRTQIAIILLLLVSANLFADQEDFSRANELYQNEQYQEALGLYLKLRESGVTNENLEYNIGSCYYRLEQPGKARLHFEKALLLAPGEADARYNIEFIERRFLKKTLREENFVTIDRFLWNLVSSFPPAITLWAGVLAFMLIFILITIKMLAPGVIPPALRWTLTIILACVVLVSFSISFTREILFKDHSYGIIIEAGVGVLSAPDSDAHSRFPAPEAIKVRITRRQDDWIEIVLPNGSKGWVQKQQLGVI